MRTVQYVAAGYLLLVFLTVVAAKAIDSSDAKDEPENNKSVVDAEKLLISSNENSETTHNDEPIKEEIGNSVQEETTKLKTEPNLQVENFSNIAKEEVISENFNDTPATEKAEEKAPQIERSGEEANHAIQNSKLRPIGDGSDYKKIGEADSEKTILEKQTDHENENVKEYSGSETTELETKDTFGKEQNLDENEEAKLKTESVETQDDTSKSQNSTQSQEEHKVTYNGVKILRVVIQNKEQRKMLKQLENNGDIDTWLGNGTAVDILIRQNNVTNFLKDKKLVYDIVIDDLQKAIEEENPPLAEDEWSELEGRKVTGLVVETYSQRIGNSFLSPFHYWIFNGMPQIKDRIDYDHNRFYGLRKKKIKQKKHRKKKKRGHRMTWQMYHRMKDIHGYLDYLTATYPDMCTQEIIGFSVEGKPLKVLKISSGKNNSRAIWVDSGIHAREWITPATSTYAINQMVENGDGTYGVDWYFLPLVNPDGYEHSHVIDRLWRKNRSNPYKGPCAGTDLNRNFGYRWGGQGSSQQPCKETYAGAGPFSEPETNAIRKFVLNKSKDLKAYISLHSYGQYILYPWGYDRKVPPDYSDLHRVGRAMAQAMKTSGGQIYKVGSAAATLYPAAGGSDDWAKGTARIKFAYTIELRDTGRYGFVLPAQYIQPTAQEAYAALKTLASEVVQL